MLLRNLHIVGKGETDLRIEGRKIVQTGLVNNATRDVDLQGFIGFPGLINAHDHLEFNLFPQLGAKYSDYTQWGPDIHERYKDDIDRILKIPRLLRIQWGLLKNILNGVTTVVEHSRLHQHLESGHINIIGGFTYLHSLALEKRWRMKLNNPFTWLPVMAHIGEGVNQKAQDEIDVLIKSNFFKKKLIGVHGIAMDEEQAKHFEALVWCPDSNLFLYDNTASVDKLKSHTKVLFGTDSTLSASANLWEQLRLARKQQMLSDQELFDAVGASAAAVFRRPNIGITAEGKSADLVIAHKKYADPWESFYALNPSDIMAVIKAGRIICYDEEMQGRLANVRSTDFAAIQLGRSRKYLLKELANVIRSLEGMEVPLPLPVKSLDI